MPALKSTVTARRASRAIRSWAASLFGAQPQLDPAPVAAFIQPEPSALEGARGDVAFQQFMAQALGPHRTQL